MTKEQAIELLKADIKHWENTSVSVDHLYMAIKALEQQTILLDRMKQAREEIKQNAYPIVHGVNNHDMGMTLDGIFQVLDKLIEESEEDND